MKSDLIEGSDIQEQLYGLPEMKKYLNSFYKNSRAVILCGRCSRKFFTARQAGRKTSRIEYQEISFASLTD